MFVIERLVGGQWHAIASSSERGDAARKYAETSAVAPEWQIRLIEVLRHRPPVDPGSCGPRGGCAV